MINEEKDKGNALNMNYMVTVRVRQMDLGTMNLSSLVLAIFKFSHLSGTFCTWRWYQHVFENGKKSPRSLQCTGDAPEDLKSYCYCYKEDKNYAKGGR